MISYSEEYLLMIIIIDEEFDVGGNYLIVFGIIFIFQVSGISLGIFGLLVMGYVLFNFVMLVLGEY